MQIHSPQVPLQSPNVPRLNASFDTLTNWKRENIQIIKYHTKQNHSNATERENRITRLQKSAQKSSDIPQSPRWNTIPTQSHRPPSKNSQGGNNKIQLPGERTDGQTGWRKTRLLTRRSRATLTATLTPTARRSLLRLLLLLLLLTLAGALLMLLMLGTRCHRRGRGDGRHGRRRLRPHCLPAKHSNPGDEAGRVER